MEYTKGKWRAKNNGYRFDILDKDGRNILASSRGMEELEANAHLIAASPKMYEACNFAKQLMGLFSEFLSESKKSKPPQNIINSIGDMVSTFSELNDKALAKADGRE